MYYILIQSHRPLHIHSRPESFTGKVNQINRIFTNASDQAYTLKKIRKKKTKDKERKKERTKTNNN